ncbi:hypothetical protein BKA61DRAFT_91737 [Leptodontidium sp. MPI-SDFR-AT-0119]|nr:hypothetical protein BKA61DRAFT_91737 [Leptodontidium sp. MPI-SDFR-AT-0119]
MNALYSPPSRVPCLFPTLGIAAIASCSSLVSRAVQSSLPSATSPPVTLPLELLSSSSITLTGTAPLNAFLGSISGSEFSSARPINKHFAVPAVPATQSKKTKPRPQASFPPPMIPIHAAAVLQFCSPAPPSSPSLKMEQHGMVSVELTAVSQRILNPALPRSPRREDHWSVYAHQPSDPMSTQKIHRKIKSERPLH